MKRVQFLLIFSIVLLVACSKDKLPSQEKCDEEVTYSNQIEPLIKRSCAYVNCHVSGFASGDYSTFATLDAAVQSGKFETRVLGAMDMPPNYAPEGKPKSLTMEELELIECWKANDYAE